MNKLTFFSFERMLYLLDHICVKIDEEMKETTDISKQEAFAFVIGLIEGVRMNFIEQKEKDNIICEKLGAELIRLGLQEFHFRGKSFDNPLNKNLTRSQHRYSNDGINDVMDMLYKSREADEIIDNLQHNHTQHKSSRYLFDFQKAIFDESIGDQKWYNCPNCNNGFEKSECINKFNKHPNGSYQCPECEYWFRLEE